MVFDWIFGALKPKCVTCKKLLKDKWFEDFGENFCSKECSSKYAESNEWVRDFHQKVKNVQDFRKINSLNRPGAIPQTRDGQGGDFKKKK